MEKLKQVGHQGDVQVYSIADIPKEAKKTKQKRFFAASEQSGSVHALFGDYDMYEVDDGFVIDCKDECILNHTLTKFTDEELDDPKVLPKKDHRHSVLPKGKYIVGIQNRFDPMENIKKKVVD